MILEVNNLSKEYPITSFFGAKKKVQALTQVSFTVQKGETLGIVGESGCGKSTLAKTLLWPKEKTSGEILFNGQKADQIASKEWCKTIQMVFQDPYGSLNPRKQIWEIITKPLLANKLVNSKKEAMEIALQKLHDVGLRPDFAHRYPHMLSGGQRQRIGIARSMTLGPPLLICDEPVSALDISIQAQVLNLLIELQDRNKLTTLFISHDLSVVSHISHSIMVMYLGRIVEYGPREKVAGNPLHPYTQALYQSSPNIAKQAGSSPALSGELPSPINPPSGCAFHKRCPMARPECSQKIPQLREKDGRMVACDLL